MSTPADPPASRAGADEGGLDPRLRGLLVCPSCRGELTEVPGALRCEVERTRYPVHRGVPWLHPDWVIRDPPAPAVGSG